MDQSLLSRLSPELRNQIYSYTFVSNYAVTLECGKTQHPLTKTCRQIREETLAMYYSKTRFNAHLEEGPVTPLTSWLECIGREACLLICEINVWDMHNHILSIYSPLSASSLLNEPSRDNFRFLAGKFDLIGALRGEHLDPIGLLELNDTLCCMQLSLNQVCEEDNGNTIRHSWFSLIDDAVTA